MKNLLFSLAFLTLTLSCSKDLVSEQNSLDPDLYGEWHRPIDGLWTDVIIFSSNGMLSTFELHINDVDLGSSYSYPYWVEAGYILSNSYRPERYSVSRNTLELLSDGDTYTYTRQ